MIICSKCRAMNKYDKFIFECPECGKKFKGNEENLEDKFKEFSISCTPKANKKISFNKNIKSGEIKLKTPRTTLSSLNLYHTEKNEKKKLHYSSTKSLVYSSEKKLISGISNANTTNTENINKDSYNDIDNNNNIFFVPNQKKIVI